MHCHGLTYNAIFYGLWDGLLMPKRSKELSAMEIARLSAPGQYAAGGVPGLYLYIEGGSKHWVLRFNLAGKRRRFGLGAYPAITLAQARETARQARQLIAQGVDPIDERRQAQNVHKLESVQAVTFEQAALGYIADNEAGWKNAKHRQQWENTLSTYAFKVIGHLPVAEVGQEHVIQILNPIWRIKTDTAKRLRGRIEKVLNWAKARGYRTGDNPARWEGHLDQILPNPAKVKKRRHHPAVPYKEVPQAVQRIAATPGRAAQALIFTLLTAARSVETFGAKWSEFDFESHLWTVPAERMKSGRAHRVPLSAQVLELLEKMPRFTDTELVFPGRKMGRPLSNMSMINVMRRLKLKDDKGVTAVPHGFRSSFRSWAADCTDAQREVAEMALAHVVEDDTEASYWRSDVLQKRRALMQQWADYCLGAGKA